MSSASADSDSPIEQQARELLERHNLSEVLVPLPVVLNEHGEAQTRGTPKPEQLTENLVASLAEQATQLIAGKPHFHFQDFIRDDGRITALCQLMVATGMAGEIMKPERWEDRRSESIRLRGELNYVINHCEDSWREQIYSQLNRPVSQVSRG